MQAQLQTQGTQAVIVDRGPTKPLRRAPGESFGPGVVEDWYS
jgi:hypothetical protein